MFQPIWVRHNAIYAELQLCKPGAYHHACFMGKSIYILKIYILSHVFTRLIPWQLASLEHLVCYIVCIYGRYFLSGPLADAAPRHDLQFWYDLQSYSHVDPQLSDKALRSMRNHLWSLAPELVVLPMFDNDVSDDEKELMAVTLLSYDQPQVFAPGKPAQPDFGPVADKLGNDRPALSQLISECSWLLFEHTKPYLRLTHPGDVPDNAATPIMAD